MLDQQTAGIFTLYAEREYQATNRSPNHITKQKCW